MSKHPVILKGELWSLVRTRRGLAKTKEAPKGLWGYAWSETREIRVRPPTDFPNVEKEADILIHEALHACLPDVDEAVVTQTATEIARALSIAGVLRSGELEARPCKTSK